MDVLKAIKRIIFSGTGLLFGAMFVLMLYMTFSRLMYYKDCDNNAEALANNIISAQAEYHKREGTYTTDQLELRILVPDIPESHDTYKPDIASEEKIKWSVTSATVTAFHATVQHDHGTNIFTVDQTGEMVKEKRPDYEEFMD